MALPHMKTVLQPLGASVRGYILAFAVLDLFSTVLLIVMSSSLVQRFIGMWVMFTMTLAESNACNTGLKLAGLPEVFQPHQGAVRSSAHALLFLLGLLLCAR